VLLLHLQGEKKAVNYRTASSVGQCLVLGNDASYCQFEASGLCVCYQSGQSKLEGKINLQEC
jgi:hypothetical protein